MSIVRARIHSHKPLQHLLQEGQQQQLKLNVVAQSSEKGVEKTNASTISYTPGRWPSRVWTASAKVQQREQGSLGVTALVNQHVLGINLAVVVDCKLP